MTFKNVHFEMIDANAKIGADMDPPGNSQDCNG